MKIIKNILLIGALLTTVLFSSCDENPLATIFDAKLRVINSSSNFQVNLFRMDSDTISPSLLQYTNAYGYRNLTGEQTHTVLVRGFNTTQNTSVEYGNTLGSNKYYTWFVHDNLNITGFGLTPVEDNLSSPASGRFKIRASNFARNVAALNIQITSGANMFSGVAFEDVTGYSEFTAGTYSLEVRDANNLYYTQSVTFTDGKIYDIVISGLNIPGSQVIFTVYTSN